MGHMGTHAVAVSLYPTLAYKPDVDFEPIGLVVEQPILIGCKKGLSTERPGGICGLCESKRREAEYGACSPEMRAPRQIRRLEYREKMLQGDF
jgi:hypothetical protein